MIPVSPRPWRKVIPSATRPFRKCPECLGLFESKDVMGHGERHRDEDEWRERVEAALRLATAPRGEDPGTWEPADRWDDPEPEYREGWWRGSWRLIRELWQPAPAPALPPSTVPAISSPEQQHRQS